MRSEFRGKSTPAIIYTRTYVKMHLVNLYILCNITVSLRKYILIFHGPNFKCFIDYTKIWITIIIFLSTLNINKNILKKQPKKSFEIDISSNL